MDGWENLINKNIKVIFDDGRDGAQRFGLLIEVNETIIILRTKTKTEGIAKDRIIRLEEVEENGH